MSDPPVQPAVTGTHRFADHVGATYTVGDEAPAMLGRLLSSNRSIAVDIETFGLDEDATRIKAVQFGVGEAAVVLDPRDPAQAEVVRRAMADAGELVIHGSAFDVPNLCRNRLMAEKDIAKVVDTLIYARLAEPDEHISKSLTKAGERYLGTSGDDPILSAFRALGLTKKEGFRRFDLDRPVWLMGAASDPLVTFRLLPKVKEAARRTLTDHPYGKAGVEGADLADLIEREQIVNRMMLRRAARGLRVDLEFLDTYRNETTKAKQEAERTLVAAGIEPGNRNQLAQFLGESGAFPADYQRTPKTKAPSMVADDLSYIEHPLAQAHLAFVGIDKIDKDYLAKVVDLADDGDRIHPATNLLAAVTGRMSMGTPPLQQFPEGARGIILADEGDQLASIDWSQIEPVVAANVARDEQVLAGYEDGSSDVYTTIAQLAAVDRKTAKVIVLAQMYGEGMSKLARDLRIPVAEAEKLRDAVFTAMPLVAALLRLLRTRARQHRKIITVSGRILPIPLGFYNGKRSVQAHKGCNYFVQGSAYDVLAEALVRVERAGLGDAVYLALHDELLVSDAAAHDINQIMQEPPPRLCRMSRRTPILRTDAVTLGKRWAAA